MPRRASGRWRRPCRSGVARISAQGQAMISAAAMRVSATSSGGGAGRTRGERERAERQDGRHEVAGPAVGQALDGRLPRLRLLHQADHLRQRRLLADGLGLDLQQAERVDRAGVDRVAGLLGDGSDSPVSAAWSTAEWPRDAPCRPRGSARPAGRGRGRPDRLLDRDVTSRPSRRTRGGRRRQLQQGGDGAARLADGERLRAPSRPA